MKKFSLFVVAGVAMILAAGSAPGQNKSGQNQSGQSQNSGQANKDVAQAANRITYNPPNRKAPEGRIGASTRGGANRDLTIEVLAPNDHIGQSASSQPVLYGYLSRPITQPLELTIDTHELGQPHEPLLEVMLNQDRPAGIFALDLHDFGVRLSPGVIYRWSIAVIVDPDQRSGDLIASGLILHVPPPPDFAATSARLQGDALTRSYADHGYWYDAIKAVSQGSNRQSDWHQQRADLLDQVSLPAPAALDRSVGTKP
jgi:hypothetical protein